MSDFLKHISDNIQNLKHYQPGKTIEEIQRTYQLDHVVKLGSNENPLGASEKAKQAIIQNIDKISQYPEDAAPNLLHALANYTQTPADHITIGGGSSETLDMIIHLLLHKGDNLIVCEHAFALFQVLALSVDADINIVKDNNFQQDLNGILEAINEKTRLIIIANPNNPTGCWHTHQELFAFIRQVPKDVVIVIDEAYHEYMTHSDYKSALELLPECPNLIVSRTFSKAFGLAGLRFGYCLSSPEIAALLAKLRKPFNVTNLTLIAAEAALNDSAHQQQTIALNQQGMKQLGDYFQEKNLAMLAQAGNFITVKFGENALKIAQELLTQGVIVRPLVPYNMPDYLRVSIGTPQENAYLMQKLDALIA